MARDFYYCTNMCFAFQTLFTAIENEKKQLLDMGETSLPDCIFKL